MKKPAPFLLLELLIALTLFACCAPLFVKNPLLLLNKERASLEKMELARLAENAFCHIKAQLYQNKIEWDAFSARKKEALYREEEEVWQLSFPHSISKTYTEKYKIWTIQEKTDEKSHKTARRVGIEIIFTPKNKKGFKDKSSFFYEVCVLSLLQENRVKPA